MSNWLEPYQDRPSVGPDMGPNCFKMFSGDDISRHLQGKSLQS